jgi:hypothetical protein
MVETMREKGDHDGADLWLRIIVAIGTLGEPTAARHYSKAAPRSGACRVPRGSVYLRH